MYTSGVNSCRERRSFFAESLARVKPVARYLFSKAPGMVFVLSVKKGGTCRPTERDCQPRFILGVDPRGYRGEGMSPTLLERLRAWTEAGIAASPGLVLREIGESADELERLRIELIKVWGSANELRHAAQRLEQVIAATIDRSPAHSTHEVARPARTGTA